MSVFLTKANSFQAQGNFQYSQINDVDDSNGFKSYLEFNKTKGKYRFGIGGNYVSKDYDNNDLGINFQTHYHSFYGNASYRILKPTKWHNTFKLNLNVYSEFDNHTGKTQNNYLNLFINSNTTKNDYFGYGVNSRPFKVYDFYEPRSADNSKFVIYPETYETWFNFSSNIIRKFSLTFNPSATFFNEKDRMNYSVFISPRYRFSDRLSLVYTFKFSRQNKNIGWVDFDENGNTIFARRDRITYINTLQGKYSLNSNMNLNLTVRHYWSYAINHDYLTLQDDGTVTDNLIYNTNKNSNLNTWNLDLSYSWWFAPGSQVSVLYRNSSSLFSREYSRQFESNFRDAIDNQNLSHVFSISVRYFIDYNSLKNSKLSKSFTKPKETIHF